MAWCSEVLNIYLRSTLGNGGPAFAPILIGATDGQDSISKPDTLTAMPWTENNMKIRIFLLIFLTTLTTWTPLLGQDGSDILYGKVDQLDESFIGDFVHLDFYNRSFRGTYIDTITILVDNKPVKFVEHRRDNGYDNWFTGQYHQSLEKNDDLTIRVVKSRLDKVTIDSIFVTNYLEYYKDGKLISDKSKQIASEFSRDIIVEVLVSEDSHRNHTKRYIE